MGYTLSGHKPALGQGRRSRPASLSKDQVHIIPALSGRFVSHVPDKTKLLFETLNKIFNRKHELINFQNLLRLASNMTLSGFNGSNLT